MLIRADARQIPLPDRWVQTVITSPPYWGLRDYGVAGQIGLEQTPEAYVAGMVEVFREIWRVLRDDGTVWLNLGDSYARNGGTPAGGNRELLHMEGVQRRMLLIPEGSGLKPKDLVGIPWRVAFALQQDGWYLRSDIIWAKPNPMPESVTDRPTRAHEYIFLLTKAERYYYDAEAVREPFADARNGADGGKKARQRNRGGRIDGYTKPSGVDPSANGGRNRRSVWAISSKPFPGAHFATFPPDLVEPCLLAGAPPMACSACGSPYRRVVEKGAPNLDQQQACGGDATGAYDGVAQKDYAAAGAQDPSAVKARILAGMLERRTVGWDPTCACDAEPCQAVVFDPFCGSGTVGVVADRHQRFFVGTDLNADYLQLAVQRRAAGR